MDSLSPKPCNVCGVERSPTNCYKQKARKDGLCSTCKKCMNERNRAWVAANRERSVAHKKRWMLANVEKHKATSIAWGRANPERVAANYKAWVQANPGKVKERDHKKRARRCSAEGSFTAAEFVAKVEQHKGRCHWCHKKIVGTPHADHVIAIAKGGKNSIDNVVPSCAKCNQRKGAKMPWDFMEGRLF